MVPALRSVLAALGPYPLTALFTVLCVAPFLLLNLRTDLSDLGRLFDRMLTGRGLLLKDALRWGVLLYHELLPSGAGRQEPWRFLSAVFFHFGLLHLAFNSLALVDFGRVVEGRFGSGRFATVFVCAGIAGFLASDPWYTATWPEAPLGTITTGGASGSIFGLAGCLIGDLYARRDPLYKRFLIHIAVFALIVNLVTSVNNLAHLGGGVVGAALGYAFSKERFPRTRNKLFSMVGAVLVAACFVSLGLSLASPLGR